MKLLGPEPLVLSTSFVDFDALEASALGWDLQYDLIGRGKFTGDLLFSDAGQIQFNRVRWNRKVLFRGAPPRDVLTFVLPLRPEPDSTWLNGHTLGNNDLCIYPPNTDAEFLSGARRDGMIMTVPQAKIDALVAALSGQRCTAEGIHGIFRLSATAAQQIRTAATEYTRLISAHLIEGAYAEVLEQAADQVAKLCVMGALDCETSEPTTFTPSEQLARKAEDLVDAETHAAVGLTEVCDTLGVSARTLHNAFLEVRGLSPAKWLRVKRLNLVRRRLLTGTGKNLVKQAALAHGFLHLGHFSAQYKTQFGELPTETLQLGGTARQRQSKARNHRSNSDPLTIPFGAGQPAAPDKLGSRRLA